MADKTATNPKGQTIEFKEEKHTYTVDGVQLESVTTILHDYFPEFNSDYWAPRKAQQEGLTVEEILQKWKDISDEACAFGTKVHLFCEQYLNGDPLPKPDSTKELKYFTQARKFINGLKKDYEIIEVEQIVFAPRYGLAGTMDLLARHKKTGQYAVFDWKTNKEIKCEHEYDPKERWGYWPLDGVMNTNLYHYYVQLNLYRILLHAEGYCDCFDADMAFFHFSEHQTTVYEVPRLNAAIHKILLLREEKWKDRF